MSLAALLVYEQQASLKWWPSSVHLTACGDCKKKIYEPTSFIQMFSGLKSTSSFSNFYIEKKTNTVSGQTL